jgi:hypothetical protein
MALDCKGLELLAGHSGNEIRALGQFLLVFELYPLATPLCHGEASYRVVAHGIEDGTFNVILNVKL